MACRRAATLALLLALSACREAVELTVTQGPGGAISLAVTSRSSDFHACIDSASIQPIDQPGRPLWELGRADPSRCEQRVDVGTGRAGFAQRSTGPVRANGRYCAEVRGPGFAARRGFSIMQGRVVEVRSGDAAC